MDVHNQQEIVKRIENLIKDDVKFEIKNKKKLSVKQIRELEKSWNQVESGRKNLMVLWDDVIQYTTLGLIQVLIKNFNLDPEWDYSDFFYRDRSLSKRNVFIRHFFKERGIDPVLLSDDFIYGVELENYPWILRNSPMSTMFISLVRTETLHSVYTFVFKAPFGTEHDMQTFVKGIQHNHLLHKTKTNLIALKEHMDEVDIVIKYGMGADVVYTPYASEIYAFYSMENITGKTIAAPYTHAGFSEEFLDTNAYLFKKTGVTASGTELVLYDETIAIS